MWFPTLPTDRLRRQPGAPPDDVPLVTHAHDGRRDVLAAACRAALALGLRPGLPLAEARARIPGLEVREADPAGDAAALRDLAAWALRWTPLVTPDGPDGLLLDVTGAAALHGGEAALLERLVRGMRGAGLAARAAVAGTPGAARAVARFGKGSVVPSEGEATALAPLPVAALGIAAATAVALRALGVDTVADLTRLPRGPLARRFGADVLLRLDRALGRLPEPLQPWTPPEAIQPRIAFLEPLFTAEALGIALDRLVALACDALEARGLGARRLDLLCERVDGTVQAIRIGTARPSRDRAHLSAMLRARLEQVEPGWGIEAMRLHLRAEPLAPEQRGALAGQPDLAALVDRLAARFEGARVFAILPVESRVPERSVRRAAPLAGSAAWPIGAPRPVRLLHPPEPVEAIAALPDRPPAAFTWRRVRRRIQRADGPERIAGEWWRRDAEWRALRDYWAVEDETGRRFWLFRRGDAEEAATGDLRWFLHGLF